MKNLAENYIRKTKNKDFKFDKNLTTSLLLNFIVHKLFSFFRSLKFLRFNQRGKLMFFGKRVQLFNKKNMRFGNNTVIGDYVKISALGQGKLELGDNVNIGSFSQIIISTSFNNIGRYIKIGDNVGMGEFAYIGGGGGTKIGKDTIIGQYFSTHPENHNFSDKSKLIRDQGVSRKGIQIGDNCWIGSKVTILDGVVIGNNCVIAAGSVVTKGFPQGSVIGGVPAKLIKNI
ncbi:MAG: acyltransferase [Bizionia sp.]|nr:acyltransferase [Bizionia sp.]